MAPPPDVPLGRPYGEALGLSLDVLIDADVTRNRPDCWGYVGVARDLAARLGVAFRPPAPVLGAVGPEEFVPIAEETGLIDQVGDWVLDEACRQLASWRARFEDDFFVSVNIAARQLRQPNSATRIRQCNNPESRRYTLGAFTCRLLRFSYQGWSWRTMNMPTRTSR